MKHLPISDVVLDYDFYPRGEINRRHMMDMVEALETGAGLPPIIICKTSKRVVDGFHRTIATKRFLGDGARIEVIEKTYRDDASFVHDIVKYNAAPKLPLDRNDKVRLVHIGKRVGLSVEKIAEAMHMPVDKLADLAADRTAVDRSAKLEVPLKRPLRHLRGRRLTRTQIDANEKCDGWTVSYHAGQLTRLLETPDFYRADTVSLEKLTRLRDAINATLDREAEVVS